jgi:hypothetical protein
MERKNRSRIGPCRSRRGCKPGRAVRSRQSERYARASAARRRCRGRRAAARRVRKDGPEPFPGVFVSMLAALRIASGPIDRAALIAALLGGGGYLLFACISLLLARAGDTVTPVRLPNALAVVLLLRARLCAMTRWRHSARTPPPERATLRPNGWRCCSTSWPALPPCSARPLWATAPPRSSARWRWNRTPRPA